MNRQPWSVRLAEGIAESLRRVLPTSVLRLAFRAGYRVMSVWWFLTKPSASGAKVAVTRGDQMLFIRLTYGARGIWDIPGGTAAAGESPAQTAARELFEEVGLAGTLEPLGRWTGSGRGREAQLHGFRLEVDPGSEPRIDEAEIAEARWFEMSELPDRIALGSEQIVKAAMRSEANA